MTGASQLDEDEADMRALQQGEAVALNRLMSRWETPLRGFLFRHTRNEQDALDLAQETFVRIYQHRARFRTGAKFSTWMFQIGLNLSRDLGRRTRHRAQTPLDRLPEPSSEIAPDAALATEERATAVRAAITELPDDLREAVLLSEYSGKSHGQIAEIVGASAKAIETRLYRARAQLRKTLAHFFADRPPGR